MAGFSGMGNSKIRKAIDGLRLIIEVHQRKIERERVKPQPNKGRIRHWENEISAFTARLRRLENRLVQRRRRG